MAERHDASIPACSFRGFVIRDLGEPRLLAAFSPEELAVKDTLATLYRDIESDVALDTNVSFELFAIEESLCSELRQSHRRPSYAMY